MESREIRTFKLHDSNVQYRITAFEGTGKAYIHITAGKHTITVSPKEYRSMTKQTYKDVKMSVREAEGYCKAKGWAKEAAARKVLAERRTVEVVMEELTSDDELSDYSVDESLPKKKKKMKKSNTSGAETQHMSEDDLGAQKQPKKPKLKRKKPVHKVQMAKMIQDSDTDGIEDPE